MVCVQAALNYFNWNENFLTRMFTLEYSYWFDYLLPGLDRLGLPIPLGGTSNHFKTEKLRELGGWDPFNVTEDADLGIRAAMRGYTVGVVNSTTYEEANNRVGNWIRQRSRWIKGYMQTTLVHSRNPWRLLRQVGPWKFLGFFLLIAGTPSPSSSALGFGPCSFSGSSRAPGPPSPYFPPFVLYLSSSTSYSVTPSPSTSTCWRFSSAGFTLWCPTPSSTRCTGSSTASPPTRP